VQMIGQDLRLPKKQRDVVRASPACKHRTE
jgi:hypothetical protein